MVVANYLSRNQLTGCAALDAALQRIDRQRVVGGTVDAIGGVAGRYVGGLFTLYVSTGGRFGEFARKGPRRYGYLMSNLMLASLGALLRLATKTGAIGVTVADMAVVMLTGRAGAAFGNDQWVGIVRALQRCSLTVDAEDQESYRRLYHTLDLFSQEVRP